MALGCLGGPLREQARSHRVLAYSICAVTRSIVGASLLAKAAYLSTSLLNDPPLSRAGSLPHFEQDQRRR
ncbi:hypothetical protein C3E98_003640 [Pseudomonas sp. MWU13-2625]|nr:hypothetical protein C3E98_003640 [Pseudomonas sp. MWU13-2625]